jgi:hypothetical protein
VHVRLRSRSRLPQRVARSAGGSREPTYPGGVALTISRSAAVAVLGALLLTACGSGSAPSTTAASPSASSTNPYGDPPKVDPPGPTDAVLTLTGGSAGSVSFTMKQLEVLGETTLTIHEPFARTTESFSVVPLTALLSKAGIAGGACINTIALNDYRYRNQAGEFLGSQAAVATRLGGQPIAFDRGGPIRIVFPDGTAMAPNLDAWNWSLSRIEVMPVSPCSNQSP